MGSRDAARPRPPEADRTSAPPLIPSALRSGPAVLLGIAEAWVAWDLLTLSDRRWAALLSLAFLVNLAFLTAAYRFRWRAPRWIGLVVLGATYIAVHALAQGVALIPGVLFIALVIAQAEVRLFADRFAPVLFSPMSAAQRKQVMRALGRAFIRLGIALAFAILIPLFAADLASSGVFPLTSIPTALSLSAALVAIVVLIALLPTLGRTPSRKRNRRESTR